MDKMKWHRSFLVRSLSTSRFLEMTEGNKKFRVPETISALGKTRINGAGNPQLHRQPTWTQCVYPPTQSRHRKHSGKAQYV